MNDSSSTGLPSSHQFFLPMCLQESSVSPGLFCSSGMFPASMSGSDATVVTVNGSGHCEAYNSLAGGVVSSVYPGDLMAHLTGAVVTSSSSSTLLASASQDVCMTTPHSASCATAATAAITSSSISSFCVTPSIAASSASTASSSASSSTILTDAAAKTHSAPSDSDSFLLLGPEETDAMESGSLQSGFLAEGVGRQSDMEQRYVFPGLGVNEFLASARGPSEFQPAADDTEAYAQYHLACPSSFVSLVPITNALSTTTTVSTATASTTASSTGSVSLSGLAESEGQVLMYNTGPGTSELTANIPPRGSGIGQTNSGLTTSPSVRLDLLEGQGQLLSSSNTVYLPMTGGHGMGESFSSGTLEGENGQSTGHISSMIQHHHQHNLPHSLPSHRHRHLHQ
ncbi:unnamed protein product, partial [Protopolystoma xenopodis]